MSNNKKPNEVPKIVQEAIKTKPEKNEKPKTKEQILDTKRIEKVKELKGDQKKIESEMKLMENKLNKVTDSALKTKEGKKHVEKVIENKNYQKELSRIGGINKDKFNQLKKDPYYSSLLNNTSVEGLPLDYKAKLIKKYKGSNKSLKDAIKQDLKDSLSIKDENVLNSLIKTIGGYRGIDLNGKNANTEVKELKIQEKNGENLTLEHKEDLMFGEEDENGQRLAWRGAYSNSLFGVPEVDSYIEGNQTVYKGVLNEITKENSAENIIKWREQLTKYRSSYESTYSPQVVIALMKKGTLVPEGQMSENTDVVEKNTKSNEEVDRIIKKYQNDTPPPMAGL